MGFESSPHAASKSVMHNTTTPATLRVRRRSAVHGVNDPSVKRPVGGVVAFTSVLRRGKSKDLAAMVVTHAVTTQTLALPKPTLCV